MPPVTLANDQGDQLTQGEARRLLGLSQVAFTRLVRLGHLTEIRLPAGHPRYFKSELVALVEKSTRRASALS